MADSSSNRLKTLWEKEKLLITSNFSFSHSVFKRLVLQTRKNQGLFGKGLKDERERERERERAMLTFRHFIKFQNPEEMVDENEFAPKDTPREDKSRTLELAKYCIPLFFFCPVGREWEAGIRLICLFGKAHFILTVFILGRITGRTERQTMGLSNAYPTEFSSLPNDRI